MNALLEPLSEAQDQLLLAIYRNFAATGEWAIWQYIENAYAKMYGSENAGEVFASLPVVYSEKLQGIHYRLAWFQGNWLVPSEKVGLTVAGMYAIGNGGDSGRDGLEIMRLRADAKDTCDVFLEMVKFMVEKLEHVVYLPTELVEASTTEIDVLEALNDRSAISSDTQSRKLTMLKLKVLTERETYLNSAWSGAPGLPWQMMIAARVKMYFGVESVEDYILRLCADSTPSLSHRVTPAYSPLALTDSIGYLDAVWGAKFGHRLFHNVDVASTAMLAMDCGTSEEFDSRICALGDVLSSVSVNYEGQDSDKGFGPLKRMVRFLEITLQSGAGSERATDAVEILRQLAEIRVGSAHPSARKRAAQAFEQLGLRYPPASWSSAWDETRVLAIESIIAIREEVQQYHKIGK